MTPEQFKDKFFISVARRSGLIDVRVGITLKAVVTIDDESKVEEATEIAKNDLINGVYGGRREELRQLLNELFTGHDAYVYDHEAWDKLVKFQETL